MNLTPRQLDVIVAVRNFRHLHGYSPTMQELADQLGTSKVTIFEHVNALEKKRVLRRDRHKARSFGYGGGHPQAVLQGRSPHPSSAGQQRDGAEDHRGRSLPDSGRRDWGAAQLQLVGHKGHRKKSRRLTQINADQKMDLQNLGLSACICGSSFSL